MKKKLLLLGDSISTADIIKYAHEIGTYVIVADYTPYEKSSAKQMADEAWNISTADVDTLYEMAIKNDVNAVFAGVSDFNIEKAMVLCERMNLPFYATKEQLETLEDKAMFKEACIKNGIPVTKELCVGEGSEIDLNSIELPAIVKPVDGTGVIGVSVCKERTDIEKAISRAMDNSRKKQVIIEEYMGNEQEVTVHYVIQDEQVYLFGMVERHMDNPQDGGVSLPVAYTWDSKYLERYIEEVNPQVKKLFKSMDIKNGVAFLQMFVDEQSFYVYEMGFRLPGSQVYFFAEELYGESQLKMMVDYALNGNMDGHNGAALNNPHFARPCCNLYFLLKPGKIKSICGIDEIRQMQGVLNVIILKNEGDVIEQSGSLKQVFMRMHIIADNKEKLAELIHNINKTVKVYSDKGDSMLCNLFDPDRLHK